MNALLFLQKILSIISQRAKKICRVQWQAKNFFRGANPNRF